MDRQKVDMYMIANKKYFPAESLMLIREKLLAMDDEKFMMFSMVELQDPMTVFLVSLFGGSMGIDRFMLGDIGMGVLKLLTGGCCGILTIIDWCTIQKKAKENNFEKIMHLL